MRNECYTGTEVSKWLASNLFCKQEIESRWRQTELEARAIKWGTADKFGEFLVGAPTFQIYTGAKNLVPLFNKASRKAHLELKD